MSDRTAVVVGGNRIPFARAHSAYRRSSNIDMLTAAIDGLAARYGLAGQRVGEVAGGAVLKHSRDFNLTREAVLGSSLDAHTPACDVQQACATGLEAAIYIANKIRLGQIQDGIAGGADSVSDAPMSVSDGLRRALISANAAKTLPARLKALSTIRPVITTSAPWRSASTTVARYGSCRRWISSPITAGTTTQGLATTCSTRRIPRGRPGSWLSRTTRSGCG